MPDPLVVGLAALVGGLVGFAVALLVRRSLALGSETAARANGERLVAEARAKQKEILLEAKDEAIKLANDSIYGLGANLYTHDSRKVKKFFEEVWAGTIWINDPLTDNDAGPFGGFKATGGSRELGEEGLCEFQQAKHVHWDFEQEVKPWWYPYAPAKNGKKA